MHRTASTSSTTGTVVQPSVSLLNSRAVTSESSQQQMNSHNIFSPSFRESLSTKVSNYPRSSRQHPLSSVSSSVNSSPAVPSSAHQTSSRHPANPWRIQETNSIPPSVPSPHHSVVSSAPLDAATSSVMTTSITRSPFDAPISASLNDVFQTHSSVNPRNYRFALDKRSTTTDTLIYDPPPASSLKPNTVNTKDSTKSVHDSVSPMEPSGAPSSSVAIQSVSNEKALSNAHPHTR